ncbi:MAG: glycosyltransferase [bacterium]|nr:glycosyltransferase [bacterium]
MQPLVSISIIAFNQRSLISETIDSVLSQEYSRLQIVVADDGSTDGTENIILDYARRWPDKIVALTGGPNLGITGNSNRALGACKGKYIAFMGGDDLMLVGKIAKQVEYMEAHPECSICFHNVDVFNTEDGITLRRFNNWKTPRIGTMRTVLRDKTYNCACATMCRSKDCPSGGFDEALSLSSDWKFWLETLACGGQMHFIPEVLGRYRRHAGNITARGGASYKICQSDHLNTIRWMMVCYPQYYVEVISALAETLRQMRWISSATYLDYLQMSLRTRITIRALVAFIAYKFTFGRVAL